MFTTFVSKPAAAHRTAVILAALVVAAWGLLIAWQSSSYAELLGHEALADHHIPFAVHLAAFTLSWLLMTAAMMLPVSLPRILTSQPAQTRSTWASTSVVLGYLAPWVGFGLLAFVGDSRLHELAGHGGPLAWAADFIAPAILLAAGIYQLTPLKRRFLARCQPARNPAPAGALLRGLRLGADCVGSCGALMLLMFALGHHRLDWMLVLGAIAAAERLTHWGPRLAALVGIGLIAWAGLVMVG